MRRNHHKSRNPLFAKRWLADDTIIRCVQWYLRFKLSYRDLAQIMDELGICVAPCTFCDGVIRYSVDFAEAWLPYERALRRSWRCDETYIKVGGQWMYLYRAVDACGKTVESHLSRTRDIAAAKVFFRKALERHGQPRTITLEGFEATHSALRRMGTRTEFNFRWENPARIRSCQYLNNVVEQDHRRIKSRVQPMLGFKKFYNARRVIIGSNSSTSFKRDQFLIGSI